MGSNPDPARDPGALVRDASAIRSIERGSPEYPAGLNDLAHPPPRLHVDGALPAGLAVAIVGSRAATPYGASVANRLAGDLARLGVAIVSGLARGIDAAAHRGALERGGITVAVVPGGLDSVVPTHHRALAREIARSGAVVSEVESGAPKWPAQFVIRNRLIAALTQATVVVEAAERSGALSTAAVARRLGRPVLAVPGDIDRPTSRGCNALIGGGATPCASAADVMRALAAPPTPRARTAARAPIPSPRESEPAAARLLRELSERPASAEALAERAGLVLDQTLAALLELEWAAAAVRLPGARWIRAGGRR